MGYSNQIKILEQRLKQLELRGDENDRDTITEIIDQLRRLRRLDWEQTYETVDLGEER